MGANPFGQSITKELLQQSRKEIAAELGGGGVEDGEEEDEYEYEEEEEQKEDVAQQVAAKKNLEIEIDENSDYEAQNNQA